jgi:hypothetical protein
MTHVRNRRHAAATLATGVRVAPASGRTFDFNSAGSMVQQPLPARVGGGDVLSAR